MLTLAWQLGGLTVSVMVTPFWRSALMYVFNAPHALSAVVCVVSSPRSPLILLQTASHSPSTFVAATSSAVTVSTQALRLACAVAFTSSPLHPDAAPAAAQPPFVTATTAIAPASTAPDRNLKPLRLVMRSSP